MIKIISIVLFFIGLINSDPSRVTELQQIQQIVNNDIATEVSQNSVSSVSVSDTPVSTVISDPIGTIVSNPVTKGITQSQAISMTASLDANTPAASVQAVNDSVLGVPLLTIDISSDESDTISDEDMILNFTGQTPTKVYFYLNGTLEGYTTDISNPVTENVTSDSDAGVLSITADYTGITATTSVSVSLDTSKTQPYNSKGNYVKPSVGVLQGNAITLNP